MVANQFFSITFFIPHLINATNYNSPSVFSLWKRVLEFWANVWERQRVGDELKEKSIYNWKRWHLHFVHKLTMMPRDLALPWLRANISGPLNFIINSFVLVNNERFQTLYSSTVYSVQYCTDNVNACKAIPIVVRNNFFFNLWEWNIIRLPPQWSKNLLNFQIWFKLPLGLVKL